MCDRHINEVQPEPESQDGLEEVLTTNESISSEPFVDEDYDWRDGGRQDNQ